jgi:hypothetical protein
VQKLELRVHVLESAARMGERRIVRLRAGKRRKASPEEVDAYFDGVLPKHLGSRKAKTLATAETGEHFGLSPHQVNRLRGQARYWAQRTIRFTLDE